MACEPESEAKPESESWYGFNYPSFYRGYSGYPFYNYQSAYPTTYNHAMTARFVQPYNGHFVQPYRYFKREAEADSEANSEADAESWYYGYGYPSAFQQQGYSGYPFYNMYQTAYPMTFNNARFVQQPYNGHFMRPYNYNRYVYSYSLNFEIHKCTFMVMKMLFQKQILCQLCWCCPCCET